MAFAHSSFAGLSRIGKISGTRRGYARIGTDMQRVGHFRPEVPEIYEVGSRSPPFSAQRQNAARVLPTKRSGPPAWCIPGKWEDWILADRGHGPEWAHVLHVESDGWEQAWQALKEAVYEAPVQMVRILEAGGVSCGVVVDLRVGERSARVTSAWHYAAEGAAPRLVTAYPTPYNQAHGSDA